VYDLFLIECITQANAGQLQASEKETNERGPWIQRDTSQLPEPNGKRYHC